MSFLVFMALLIVASVCIDAKNSIFDQGSRIGSIKNDIEKTLREKLTMANIKAVSSRLPAAVGKSIKLSTKSFLSSSAILFPVGLALNIKQFRPIDAWLMKGAGASIEWAKLGACFTVSRILTIYCTYEIKRFLFLSYLYVCRVQRLLLRRCAIRTIG